MLDDTGTFEQSRLIGLSLEVMAQTAFDYSFQVASQLTHLACSEKHIGGAIIVEEEGGIVEVTQT